MAGQPEKVTSVPFPDALDRIASTLNDAGVEGPYRWVPYLDGSLDEGIALYHGPERVAIFFGPHRKSYLAVWLCGVNA